MLTRTDAPKVAVPPWRRQVGLLRQDPGLFPHLSVRDNLAYARGTDADRGAELTELAGALGIGDLLTAMPARLSGGQQHRAALARLLLARCEALLLDEPYSGLDAALRRTLTALVVRLVTERGVPAVLVAHELADAQSFANRMAVLDAGQVLQTGLAGPGCAPARLHPRRRAGRLPRIRRGARPAGRRRRDPPGPRQAGRQITAAGCCWPEPCYRPVRPGPGGRPNCNCPARQ